MCPLTLIVSGPPYIVVSVPLIWWSICPSYMLIIVPSLHGDQCAPLHIDQLAPQT